MKFAVESVVNIPSCKMRIGQLSDIKRIPNTVFLTPLLLLYSKGGSVPHLTREVLNMVTNISTEAVQIPISNSAECYNGVKHFKEGISSFVGLPECLSYCTVQDPAEVTKVGYNERNSISIWTRIGRKQLTPDKYMDMIEAYRPDMYHVLCDGDTNEQTPLKRTQKSVDVTRSMFHTCNERHAKSQSLKDSAMLAVVEGGFNMKARKECAQLLALQSQVQGFVIDGLHNNGLPVEQMSYETVEPVISATLKHLPEEKLRIVHGGWRPDVVLKLVQAGIDVFDSSLVYSTTERGSAFTFSYKPLVSKECNEDCKAVTEESHHKEALTKESDFNKNYHINLKEKIYFDDFTPVLGGCTCLTCTKHTRSYIHHLLNTKEMLASVLLMIHNLHHYQQFFYAIRENGKIGQLLTIDPPFT